MSKRPGIHAGVNFSSGTPGQPAGCRKCSTPKNTAAIAINTRPTVMSLLLPCPRIAFPARIQAPPANDISRKTMTHAILSLGLARARGMCTIATKRNIMIPNSRPDQRTCIFVAMLKDANSNANPTKYAQNKRHGMYEGTASIMKLAPERCSAPKTAKGTAKHKLLSATILSSPRAPAISLFAAHSATRKSTMPAPHIETAGREISTNVARMFVCMWMPGVSSGALSVLYLGRNLLFDSKTVRSIHPPQRRFFGFKTLPANDQLEIEIGNWKTARERPHPCKPRKDGPPALTLTTESTSEISVHFFSSNGT